jgi:hypothetical protein
MALLAAVIGWILWPEIATFRQQPVARRELIAFTSELSLGMTPTDVRARFAARPRALLSLREFDAKLTFAETPYTFGAGNWRAWLNFTSGRLSSVRIRTTDGERIKPDGSPPDVGVPPPGH